VLAEPGQHSRRAQHEQPHQLAFAERLGADDVDLPDLGDPPFLDVEVDRDPVALKGRYRGADADRVVAAAQVLALQFLLRAVE
jgi:hypothetical protein